jgi:hypothetical protein
MAAQTFEEHLAWLETEVPGESLGAARNRFDSGSSLALLKIRASQFWSAILTNQPEWNDAYFRETGGYKLFVSSDQPTLVRKPFDSLLDKVYRKNVVLNPNWPEPPEGGWVTQATWYAKANDIIRTTVVVKYMDGVDYFTTAATQLCESLSLEHTVDLEARPEGYYAAHFYVTQMVEIPRANWDTESVPLRLEIQVTTQLQDAIRKLTHKGYVSRRSVDEPAAQWQWDYKDANFAPNYLGHILHYVEGMIMEIRDRGKAL